MSRGSSVSSTASIALNGISSRVLVRILIGHTSEKLPQKTLTGHTHKWTVFVRPMSGELTDRSFIKKVTFNLHESFVNPLRVIKEPPFQVSETGYGGFTMPITIQFNGVQKIYTINYELSLSLDKYGEYSSEQKIELKNPSKELAHFVQKYCKKAKTDSSEVLKYYSNEKNFLSTSKHLDKERKHKSQFPTAPTSKEVSKIASKNLSNSVLSNKEKLIPEIESSLKLSKEDFIKEKNKDLIKSEKMEVNASLKIEKPFKISEGKKLPAIRIDSEILNKDKIKDIKGKDRIKEKEQDHEKQRRKEERRKREREEAQKISEVNKQKHIVGSSSENKAEYALLYKSKLEASLFGETPSTSKTQKLENTLRTDGKQQLSKADNDVSDKVKSYTEKTFKFRGEGTSLCNSYLEDATINSLSKESDFLSKKQFDEALSYKISKNDEENASNNLKKFKKDIKHLENREILTEKVTKSKKETRIESKNGANFANNDENIIKNKLLVIDKLKMKKHQENLQEIPVYDSSLKNETLIPVSSISLFPQINVFDGTIKRPNSAISTSTSSTKTSSIPATSCRGAESDNFNASEEQDDDVSTLIDEEINLITNKMDGIEGNVIYSIPNISTPMSHDQRLQYLVDQIQDITDPELMYQITDTLIESDSSILLYDEDGHIVFDMYKIKFNSILRLEKIFSTYSFN